MNPKSCTRISDNLYLIDTVSEIPTFYEHRLVIIENGVWVASMAIDYEYEEMWDLYVNEEYRRIGYATFLIFTAIRNYGMKYLTVYPDNYPALNLYKKLGFVESTPTRPELLRLEYKGEGL